MSLYLLVILASLAGPLLLSFDRKVAFYRSWKFLFPAILAVAFPFLVWDYFFTARGVWGFNEQYLEGIYLYNLPLEECLFFVVVPFCCVFIYEVFRCHFPRFYPVKAAHLFAFTMTLAAFIFALSHLKNWYTASACILTALFTLWIYFLKRSQWYAHFAVAFIVCQIPFLIVNGILTGGITEKPVVWYSGEHIIGFRIWTIPLEDIFYNYALLLPVVAIFEGLRRASEKQ